MKRLFYVLLILLLFITPAQAQGPVHLPLIIVEGGGCMNYAILEISDGDTTINLLQGSQTGFHLKEWNPAIIQPKGGGVFQDSPIAAGRRLVYDVDGTATESLELVVNSHNQNSLITQAQDLLRLLLKARAYGSTDWQDEPVWIKARATCEDNARYAQVINFNVPQLDNPYAQPFFSAQAIAAMDDITLSIERNHWLSEQPEQGADVAASNSQAWSYTGGSGTFGTSTADKLYISNKQVVAQLSHIFIDDGGAFGSNLFPVSAAFQLWPATPAVNDAVYFGIRTSLTNSGPFDNIRFYITTQASSTTSYTAEWEYWDGSAWTDLDPTDNTDGSLGASDMPFSQTGYNSVNWLPPEDWATTAVNSITGYWVRCRVTAITGTLTPPTQGDIDIVTANNGYIEIAATEILGDIPALARIGLRNDSYSVIGADAFVTRRVTIGLRSYSRGAAFQAYLNISDEQNPSGVSVALGTNTAFSDDVQAPSGRRARYNPTATEGMDARATITLDDSIARDFYGTFHVFLRAVTDNAGLSARLKVVSLSGGAPVTTASQDLEASSRLLVDFGQITLPITGNLKTSELGDQIQIIVEASATSGTPNLDLYDIVLIPVDEWAIDALDPVLPTDSQTSFSFIDNDEYLDIDSLTPKTEIRSLVRYTASDIVTSEWTPVTNGPAIFQANARQRLWVLTSIGVSTLVGQPFASFAHSVHKLQKNQRYLGMRGDR